MKLIFCRQNWVFPFVQRLQTYQIEIRSKNSRLDHLQLLKVKIRIRHQVIQDVLRLLKIQFCHQFMNSKYHKITATVPTEFHFGTATVKTALKTLVQNFHAFT